MVGGGGLEYLGEGGVMLFTMTISCFFNLNKYKKIHDEDKIVIMCIKD